MDNGKGILCFEFDLGTWLFRNRVFLCFLTYEFDDYRVQGTVDSISVVILLGILVVDISINARNCLAFDLLI